MNIGEAVRLRILELCAKQGISINKLCNISGRNNSTTVSTIKKLCDGLEITVTEFFAADVFNNLEQEIK